jgi:chromosome segregation ATPase
MMTAEEKTKFESMEHSVSQIEKDVAEIKSALLGNALSGEKGLTGRITVLDAKIELLEKQITNLSEERVKNTVYIKIINWLVGTVIAGTIAFVFSQIKIK